MYSIVIILVFVLTFLISNKLCQQTANIYYLDRIEKNKITPKIYDLGHRYLPNYSKHYLNFVIKDLYVLLLSFVPFLFTGNYEAFKDYLSFYIVIILIRSITINLTILPKDKDCKYEDNSMNPFNILNSCYDKIFSGHFATLFLATLIFYKYNIINSIPILIIINIINSFLILTTRSHYTIDIIVSLITVLLVYTNNIKVNL